MAHDTHFTVALRFRWWVRIYVVAAVLFVWFMAPWLDADDADALANSMAGFILRHGMIFGDGS